jgi:hypothetical protein
MNRSNNHPHMFFEALFESVGNFFSSIGTGIVNSITSIDRICR